MQEHLLQPGNELLVIQALDHPYADELQFFQGNGGNNGYIDAYNRHNVIMPRSVFFLL